MSRTERKRLRNRFLRQFRAEGDDLNAPEQIAEQHAKIDLVEISAFFPDPQQSQKAECALLRNQSIGSISAQVIGSEISFNVSLSEEWISFICPAASSDSARRRKNFPRPLPMQYLPFPKTYR